MENMAGIQITLINGDCVYGQWVKSYSVIQHFRKQVTVFIFFTCENEFDHDSFYC